MFHQERKNNDMERIYIRVGREGLFLRRLVTEEHVETSQKKTHTYT